MRISKLRKRRDFLTIASQGEHVVTKTMVVQALANNTSSEYDIRLGFTVTKKIGIAVMRNRVKRRLRAVAQEVIPELARKGFDYVIVARKPVLSRSYEGLVKDLKYALHQVHRE